MLSTGYTILLPPIPPFCPSTLAEKFQISPQDINTFMRYHEITINEYDEPKPDSHGIDLPREIAKWMREEGMREASLHTLWSDFPLKRHLPKGKDWDRVLRAGEKKQLWDIRPGRQEGSQIIVLGAKAKKSNNP